MTSLYNYEYKRYLVAIDGGGGSIRLGNWENIDPTYNTRIIADTVEDFINKINYYFKSLRLNKDGNDQNQLQGKEVPERPRESGGRAVRGRIENPTTVRHSRIKKRVITSKV